jgi:hypothetical protein
MSNEEVNGKLPSPTPENQARYEEWCRKQDAYWASLPRQLSEEEAEQFRDMAWAEKDPEMQRLYEDKWIAVYRRKVVAAGDDLGEVLAEASRVTGLPEGKIAVTSIPGTEAFFGGH